MVASFRSLALLGLCLGLAVTPARAQQDLISKDLPINLDADSSEIDRSADRLIFRNVTISQGDTRIQADEAVASTLDFANSEWLFTGAVTIVLQGATIRSSEARLTFADYALRSASVQGVPATFEHEGEGRATSGRAERFDYDALASTLRLSGKAWVSEGGKEVSGSVLTYDIANERVVADSGEGPEERVRIVIDPEEIQRERERREQKDSGGG
jgi:lipopolysaccharide export system protein LptA